MSYRLQKSRSHRLTRDDPRGSLPRSSFGTKPSSRMAGKSRASGSAQEPLDLTNSDDEEDRSRNMVIDLSTPSPPSSRVPSRAPAASAASSSRAATPLEPAAHLPDQQSGGSSKVTATIFRLSPAASPKDDDIPFTPSPKIKASPHSSKQKASQIPTSSQLKGKGQEPQMNATRSSRSSKRSTPEIKKSPPSTSRKRKANVEPEAEPVSNHAAEPGSQVSSPSSSSSDGDDIVSLSPSKRRRPSPDAPTRRSTRSSSAKGSTESTISLSSPLIPRLKARLERARKSDAAVQDDGNAHFEPDQEPPQIEPVEQPSQDPATVESIKTSLLSMKQAMKDDHAMSVRWLLQDARETIQTTPTLAVDKVSPFASLKSVQLQPGDKVPNGCVTEKLESWIKSRSGKFNKSKTTQVAIKISGDTPRVPRYSSHTNVSRNILSADSEKLKYVPYLGDHPQLGDAGNYRRLLKELQEVYSHGRIEPTRQSERATRIRSYLEAWIAEGKIECNSKTLIHYIISQEEAQKLGIREPERQMILDSFDEPLTEQVRATAELFRKAFKEVFDDIDKIDLVNVFLPAELLKEMSESAAKKNSLNPEKQALIPGERIGTYATLTCLICGAVDCQTHADYSHEEIGGGETEDDGHEPEYLVQRQPLVLPYNDMMRRYNIRKKAEAGNEEEFDLPRRARRTPGPCGNECWRLVDHIGKEVEWDEKELCTVQEMILSITDKDRRACQIAFALGLPCWQVYGEIIECEQNNDTTRPVEEPAGRPKRPDWYNNRNKTLHNNFQEMTKAHLHQERSQANPCTHDGHCTSKCPCYEANILCERFCGCPDDCPRKFTGCSCLSNGLNCVSESCICIQMNRECGPECVSCGAVERINPAKKYDDELFTHGCQNVPLQRGKLKVSVVGESQLVGFGLYIAEPVRKGEFISEYTGEVISSQEAERRGIIYDRKFLSFLFDLNRDYVIDAARLGNNTRFINHADCEKDGLNCEAKIILVNGEHRIKFVALRDIETGEELLFNYGKKFAEKHGLSKKLPKAKEGGKKGVLVGAEALDALDGVDDRKESVLKVAAARGRPRGSRNGKVNKMRKTAAPSARKLAVEEEPVVESVSQDQESDLYAASQEGEGEDDDEEEEEEEADEGRTKSSRKKTRPSRYV